MAFSVIKTAKFAKTVSLLGGTVFANLSLGVYPANGGAVIFRLFYRDYCANFSKRDSMVLSLRKYSVMRT